MRRAGGNGAGEVRIGRFLRNDKVTVAKIVEQAALGTASRVDGLHVLSIQDTTSFRDDGSGNSLVGHATIAVEAGSGALLGLIDTQILERFGGGGKRPKRRLPGDKQSRRWMDSMQASAHLLTSAGRVTVVADREGDIFEMFACRPEGVEVLIRAAQDRVLAEGAGKLFSCLANRPEAEHKVELPARPGQKKRVARISVRFASVTLKPPKNRPVGPDVPTRPRVYIVEARETDPPEGMKPAHWRLLSSHRVETFDQARWITQLHRQRRVIEPLKCLHGNGALQATLRNDACCRHLLHAAHAGPRLRGSTPASGRVRRGGSARPRSRLLFARRQDRKTEEPASEGISRICSMGLCPSRRLDRILRETRTRRDDARTVSI